MTRIARTVSPVRSLFDSILPPVEEKPKPAAPGSPTYEPSRLLFAAPATYAAHDRDSSGKLVYQEGKRFVALLEWPAYTDSDGKSFPATLRIARFKNADHLRKSFDESTGLVKSGAKFASLSREDLVLYAGAWEELVNGARKRGTLK